MLILLCAVPAVAGTARLAELVHNAQITVSNARFFAAPSPVILHIVSVIPYSILGALQFSAAFRRRKPGWHRMLGRVLVVLGMLSATTGLWMTLVYPWPAGDGEALYVLRLLFGSAMTMSILLGFKAVQRRNYVAHGMWMMRGYAIEMGAGTQVLTHIPYFVLLGKPGVLGRAVLMGAGWVINIVLAEWIIRKRIEWHSDRDEGRVSGAFN
jgi:uncharacterized membrane protein